MALTTIATDDPGRVLDQANAFLTSEPVLHNVVITLLRARVDHPRPGRYWMAQDGDHVVGVVFQSPLTFEATMTPMAPHVITALIGGIATSAPSLPGINGEAGTAARFAGQWTERCGIAAVPTRGHRLYELRELHAVDAVSGRLRPARDSEGDLLVDWLERFKVETGEEAVDPHGTVARLLPAGRLWLWDDGGPRSMAGLSPPVAGVVRFQAVYTPPEARCHGYASACVTALSARALDDGERCILYADLGNPTSNSIYRRMGFSAVAEILRYRFLSTVRP